VAGQRIELVVTDLDGTLWDDDEWVHPDTVAALGVLDGLGVPVLAATARRPASAWRPMRRNGIALPAVLFDGSLGRSFMDASTFHRTVFDEEDATRTLAAFLANGVEPCLNIDHPTHDFVVGPRPSTHPDHLELNAARSVRMTTELTGVLPSLDILSFAIFGRPRAELDAVLRETAGIAEGSVMTDAFYGEHSLSVRPPGVSKWSGTLAYCSHRGLDPHRVLAIGNGENDRELLEGALVACAPSDSCADALARAEHHVPPARLGGWSRILDLLK